MSAPSRPHCEKPSACEAKGAGHCRRCHIRAATKANWQDPAFREKQAAATKANWQDPAFREKQAAATKAFAQSKLAWCAPELVEDYRLLAPHLGADEARAVIELQMRDHGFAPAVRAA